MRIWHYELLPYLPDAQFKGQLREIVKIMRDWRDSGETNHLLINRVMQYEKNELVRYFNYYEVCYHERYKKWLPQKYWAEFKAFSSFEDDKKSSFEDDWHNKEYLRVCMANLYEKYHFGVGKSKISQTEWDIILQGYKKITGEDYEI